MPSVEEALEFMKTNDVRWAGLQFVDVNGELRQKTVACKGITEAAFSEGVQTDLGDVFGFSEKPLALVPDQDTFARIPWEPSAMRFISNIYSAKEKERFLKDPRYSIERVNINAKAMGISDVQISTETEFYLFDSVTGDKLSPERGPNYLIDSREAYWNPTPLLNSRSGSYASQPRDMLCSVRTQICEVLEDHFRFQATSHGHGRHASGQQKISLAAANAKLAADALVTLKYVARNVAAISNNVATFMPLPVANEKGSSHAITQRLRKGVENLFYDEKGEYAQLSQTALYYIGGILAHAEALSVFTMPTTNSYKRLKADPRYVTWSRTNPNALVYIIPATADDRTVSYTGADPSVNPYLAYAAVVAAGLDGIKNKAEPGKPVDENISGMDAKAMRELKIRPLPASMLEAVSALESDNKFLKGFISSELLADYLAQRLDEHKENEKRPTAFEIERYFNR